MSARLLPFFLPAFTLFACWDLPPGDKTSPYFWSDLFLDKYADELVVTELEPGPEPLAEPRTVLLITGVTIKAQWFDPIAARLTRDGFIPVVYEPPALLSGDLFEASEALAEVVERVKRDSGQDKIDILAECTGGLIARHYIQSLGGAEHVSRMVTFVSPQNGVDKAPWAYAIAGWPALRDLSPGSAFLRAVNDAPLPADVPFTSIYTCSDEYIQPWQTSIIPGATNIGLCDEFVGHFQTLYDPAIYLLMHEALTRPTPAELAAEPDPSEPTEPDPDPSEPEPVHDETGVVLDEGAFDDSDPASLDPLAPAPTQTVDGPDEVQGLGCGAGALPGLTLALGALGLLAARRRR